MLPIHVVEQLKNGKHLLALSGGVDSMVLAHLLLQNNIYFEVAHVNFKLRAEESNDDEFFIRQWAFENDVPVHVNSSFDTTHFSSTNLQQNARQYRYDWFSQVKKERDLNYILTAHHYNDNVETFFIQALRGASLSGLKAMPLISGKIFRPMIHLLRSDIENYAVANNIEFRSDSSNFKDDYLRNRIRQQLLPFLQEINQGKAFPGPEFFEHLQQEHRILSHLSDMWIRQVLKTDQQFTYFSIQAVLEHTEPEWALHQLVKPYALSSTQEKNLLELLIKKQANGKCILTEKYRFEIRDSKVLISHANQEQKALSLSDFTFELLNRTELISLHVPKNVALLDADLLSEHELSVRYYQTGDWFIPFGMSGKKLLSDFFKDLKWPQVKKENQSVLCKSDAIVWVINERIDQRFAITESTQKVLRITYKTM